MSTAGILEFITYAGMAASVVTVVSVLRLHGHAWKQAGRRKWLWALLPVVTYFILLSIPVAVWYYVRIRPGVAAADADCIAARVAKRNTRAANRPQAGQLPPQGSTSASWLAASPAKQVCSACTNGKQMCWTCHGRGSIQDNDSTWKSCWACNGGYTTCAMCNGSGYR
ncbi:hypothetical protein OG555_13775 [Kribbella sp. NBC_01484]|uniref:hypothetical protein n=1 Tax=Kribbella sp. NBC_01484 TaxID=2903579 RepID=UPI002E38002A|nr:hypothetical protein [Kribbella sp. NBC_01484]